MKLQPKNFILAIAICLLFSQESYAYLDPGTGSMIFQVILASLITFVCAFKSFFSGLFSKKKKEDEIDE